MARILSSDFTWTHITEQGQSIFRRSGVKRTDVQNWWDEDASKDEVKSAAGVNKNSSKTPFVKMPQLPNAKDIEGKTILDMGCGYGRTLIPLAKMNPKFAIGIDISKTMLLKCAAYSKKNKVKLILIHSDFPTIPLKDNSIDLIYSCAVFLHLEKEQIPSLLKEIRRIMKPNGKAILQSSFPNSLSFKGLSNWLPSRTKSLVTGNPILPGMPKHYSLWELERLLSHSKMKFSILPRNYELLPISLNKFNLPFREKTKKINQRFENYMRSNKPDTLIWFFPNFFDLIITKNA